MTDLFRSVASYLLIALAAVGTAAAVLLSISYVSGLVIYFRVLRPRAAASAMERRLKEKGVPRELVSRLVRKYANVRRPPGIGDLAAALFRAAGPGGLSDATRKMLRSWRSGSTRGRGPPEGGRRIQQVT